jgi:peptide-methionine (R)-S-oxide reductase
MTAIRWNPLLTLLCITLGFGAVALVRGTALAGDSGVHAQIPDSERPVPPPSVKPGPDGKVHLTDDQWIKLLPIGVYRVTRLSATEPPFSHPYAELKAKGTYVCADCGLPLFSSDTKFDSGTGWPSFWAPLSKSAVSELSDNSIGMQRTEVRCSRCGAHLGHVFDDGPQPTGLRYCMNGRALHFIPATDPAAPAGKSVKGSSDSKN